MLLACTINDPSNSTPNQAFGLARLNADGTVDFGFGELGQVITEFGPSGGSSPQSVLIQTDGNIVVTGTATGPVGGQTVSSFALSRLHRQRCCALGLGHDWCQ